jgi:hypothetical protein
MLRAHALRLRFVDSRNLYICFRECPLFCCAIPISQEFPKIPNCPESEDAGQFVLLPRIRRRWAIRNWHENSKTLWIPPSMLLHILLIPGEDNHYVFCLHRHAFSRPFVSEKAVLPCVETEYPCCSSFLRGELVERCRCPLRSIMSRVFLKDSFWFCFWKILCDSFFERMSPARWSRVFLLFSRRKLRGSHFSSASEKKVFTSYLLKRLVVSSAFRSFSRHLVCVSKIEDNKNLPEQYLGGMSPRRSPLVWFGL